MTNTMNEQFKKAAQAVKTINTKGTSMFSLLLMFAVESGATEGQSVDLKPVFGVQEKLATAELKVEMGKNSTYRVAKGTIIGCAKAGIALLDADGKPKGKTALEEELAETKTPKSELDKFKTSMTTAANLLAKLDARDRITAAALVQDLLNEATKGIALAA
jgi:acyl-CoA-binding protein